MFSDIPDLLSYVCVGVSAVILEENNLLLPPTMYFNNHI